MNRNVSDKRLRVLAIVPSILNTAPGQRYRIEQWDPLLRQMGADIEYEPFESPELHDLVSKPGNLSRKLIEVARGIRRRTSMMKHVSEFDVVYLFREAALLGPPIFESLIGRTSTPYVFDFDDAIFVSYRSPSNGYLSYLKFAGKTASICRQASHVMVGNPYLAEYVRQYNQNVTVVPTTIDTDVYKPRRSNDEDHVPVIGWTGSFSTVQHLDTMREALQTLAQRERFRLRVIGTATYDLPGVEVEAMLWRAATEVDDLCAIDVGMMPLPDDSWSKGKCGLKALQFMALGIPTGCSPVGVNTEIISDGQNGFIASTDADWIKKLTELLRSPELRRRMGDAGRMTVEEKYSAKIQAPIVFQLFSSVIQDGKVSEPTGIPKDDAQVQSATAP